MRRVSTYAHRSLMRVPVTRGRFVGGAAAAATITVCVWQFRQWLVAAHTELVLRLAQSIRLEGLSVEATQAYGQSIDIVTVTPGETTTRFAAGVFVGAAGLLLLTAHRFPLARGLVTFLGVVLALSAIAFALDAPAMRSVDTFTGVWMHTQLLVWLTLPSVAMLLFVLLQPSLLRGVLWMVGVEAFAVFWSGMRLVVVLGLARYAGTLLLPAVWFAWGLLADVLYLSVFYSWSIYVALRLPPGR